MRFSERIGKAQPKTIIQIDSMDDDLRNGLWNIITIFLIEPLRKTQWIEYSSYHADIKIIWASFFKDPIDEISSSTKVVSNELKRRFFNWHYLKVYDFVDFLASMSKSIDKEEFMAVCNDLLKEEVSGYRFINGKLAPITSEIEIKEIETAISTSENSLNGVNIHLSEALNKLSDKNNPDYRNSIKESISAVEAICKHIAGDHKAELGKALKKLKNKIPIHGGLEQGFLKIYGYTSDGDGIRHAMLEESKLDQEDAVFMLVSCSAFVNYLIAKATKSKIEL